MLIYLEGPSKECGRVDIRLHLERLSRVRRGSESVICAKKGVQPLRSIVLSHALVGFATAGVDLGMGMDRGRKFQGGMSPLGVFI